MGTASVMHTQTHLNRHRQMRHLPSRLLLQTHTSCSLKEKYLFHIHTKVHRNCSNPSQRRSTCCIFSHLYRVESFSLDLCLFSTKSTVAV